MSAAFVVHIAGPVEDGLQKCSRCGATLIDHRGQNVMVAASDGRDCDARLLFWPEGGFITGSNPTVLMGRDASEIDEERCDVGIQ